MNLTIVGICTYLQYLQKYLIVQYANIIHIFRYKNIGMGWQHIFDMGEAHGQRHQQCERTSPQMFHGWNVKAIISWRHRCQKLLQIWIDLVPQFGTFFFPELSNVSQIDAKNKSLLFKENVGVKLQIEYDHLLSSRTSKQRVSRFNCFHWLFLGSRNLSIVPCFFAVNLAAPMQKSQKLATKTYFFQLANRFLTIIMFTSCNYSLGV